ncbi:hypothetical protein QJS10_CPB15g01830 [Acorus calamus]|uniref:Uncharacterized protein n=1 Tax=Acorus calamus TaxID=4465 RepID=A0AAV9D8U9_ACOCL|nr:hypothetical protein QJS10_CPB15g01830 [Acorus calamus]
MANQGFEPVPEGDAEEEAAFARRGCCSWFIPRFGSPAADRGRSPWWERIRVAAAVDGGDAVGGGGRWWSRAFLRVREWSEIVAGPRWKTFIRRFNRNPRSGGGGGAGGGGRQGRFGYDPLSYALNFDGGDLSEEDIGGGFRDFSSRFAVAPASAKSSMDLGGRDAPPLFGIH